jgi:organic radical activating enzyme
VGVETNGTLPAPEGIDWICVSPKAGTVLAQRTGHELKVVYPQAGIDLAALESLPFRHFFLQPLDDEHANRNLEATREQCRVLPHWTLSLQTHKLLGIP